ncbi:MAG: hypothetical protein LBK97_05775, partial [Prevotellaceae bacterium]|nr:hypothetical protein [Prevotellaceae bacterium]
LYIDDISIDAVDRTVAKASDTETVSPEEQISGGNISSVGNDTVEVIRFGIHDIAGSDDLPTWLRQITVKNAKPPSCANWKTTVKNAYLYAENIETPQMANTVITDDSIVFLLNNNLPVPSGNTVGLSMKIVLNDSLADNSTLQFKIDRVNHGLVSSADGSGMASELMNDIVSGIFTVNVEADTILWRSVPNSVSIYSGFPIVAVATDSKGNIDKDFSASASLALHSGSGDLTFDPPAFVNGELSAENITYNETDNIAIQLSSESLISAYHYISIIFNRNSSIENPPENISGTSISSEAVSFENEIPVFRFVIKDKPGDGAATFVNELKFTNPLSQTNWINIIGGISLYNGEQRLVSNIIDQKRDYVRVGLFPGSLTVNDGDEKTVTLKIWLKTKAPDKTELVFMIPATNHGCQAMQYGSLFADNFVQNIVSDTFSIDVNATKIIFKNTPATVAPNSLFSLEINAVNNDETVDTDAAEEITLDLVADSGNLNSVSGMSRQLVEGKTVWSDLTIDVPMIFRIKAIHPLFGETVSNEIASMDMDSEVLPVLPQQKSVFKSTDTLMNDAKEVIRLTVSDKGTNDGLPTVIGKMVFGTISEIPAPDLIGGIELLSDNQNIPLSFTSSGSQITVVPDSLTVPDGESRDIILKIFLKQVKCADKSKLQLYVPATAHGWTVKQNSSQLLKTFEYAIYSEVHSIDIEASRLMILNQPVMVQKDTPFSFDVGATDYMGNVDMSFDKNISILKSSGTGSLQNVSATQSAGISTFSMIYDSTGDFSFKAASAAVPDAGSMPIYSTSHIDTAVKSGISAWNNTGDWIWNGSKLKHNSGNGLSYVYAPLDANLAREIVQWDFTVENGNFDPSAENAFWCVLSSDSDDLNSESLSGYIAGINYTGNSDLISFWKVKSGSKQLLWSGNYDWNENATVRIVVQKIENEWQFFFKEKERPILPVGKFRDNDLLFDCKFSGFVFKYTSTRNGLLSLNDYAVIKTNQPLRVSKAEILDKNSVKISFSTNITFPDALSPGNYILNTASDTFNIFAADKIADNEVKLSTQLLCDTLFFLSVSGITDFYGSVIKDTVINLRRNAPKIDWSLYALNRNLLTLEFSQNMVDTIILNTNNYRLINTAGNVFSIKNITKDSGKFYLDCDSLYGNTFVLYCNGLETEDGFILTDSVILNKAYLPAKIGKVEATSSSTITVE